MKLHMYECRDLSVYAFERWGHVHLIFLLQNCLFFLFLYWTIPYFNHITTNFSKNVRFFLNIKNLQTVMQNIISESWSLNCDVSVFWGKNLYIPSFPPPFFFNILF